MSEIDTALARLERATAGLEEALADGAPGADLEAELLRRERDGLAEEVDALRAAAERDAELRAEAANAVRTALADLRALVPEDRTDG